MGRQILEFGYAPMSLASTITPIRPTGDIVDAIVYLTEARHVTGEVLHVDAGAHSGKW
jgi:enoyl-[acyl-carrier-protein] reductase (NADH)